ncbi:unnamed protein product [Arabidopsis arenosa]|uniref:Protein kinase domain-containing protein n=1 Tax=Arabidopsis arenosa TaxID=38785 RepID=A0A8S2B083_ARAAE|nr:unnamed protein product [Arabidopsis arenosa]
MIRVMLALGLALCMRRFAHVPRNLQLKAWRLWRKGSPLELVDPTISENCETEEVISCIHIALLCVQHSPTDRPNLSTINMMLTNNSYVLPDPQQPGFFFPNKSNKERDGLESSQSTNRDPLIAAFATLLQGIIVGITVVLALVISVLLALGYALCRRRKASQEFATERSSMTNCGTAPPDDDMNPKIADFGMARNFRVDQTEDNTGRVVGTFGYMPPEYVANGQFSMKSDVYSFGVLILEIIVGKKSSSFHQIDSSVGNLVTYVWRLWNNGLSLELIDPVIGENYDKDEVIRCIHIGLLCVQENPADRPTMSNVFQMLTNNSITLPVPQTPGFVFRVRSEPNPLAERYQPRSSTAMSFACSIDDASITSVNPR